MSKDPKIRQSPASSSKPDRARSHDAAVGTLSMEHALRMLYGLETLVFSCNSTDKDRKTLADELLRVRERLLEVSTAEKTTAAGMQILTMSHYTTLLKEMGRNAPTEKGVALIFDKPLGSRGKDFSEKTAWVVFDPWPGSQNPRPRPGAAP